MALFCTAIAMKFRYQLQNDLCLRQRIFICKCQMNVDLVTGRYLPFQQRCRFPGDMQGRFAAGQIDNLNISPEYAMRDTGAQRLAEGFFCSEAFGVACRLAVVTHPPAA